MTKNSSSQRQSACRNWRWPTVGLGAILLLATHVQAIGQQRFKSPDEAAQALAAAAKADDPRRVLAIFGRAGRGIVESGDKVADRNTRADFVAAYDAKNRISTEGDSKAILVVGQDDWPFPIPLIRKSGAWRFDAAAGEQEILFRRIGRDENNVIQVCLAYIDAQKEYASMDPQGVGVATYARRVVSRPGKKDGLYWLAKDGEQASPLGELAASAAREGYRPGTGRAPFHGYYFKILTGQGSAAEGGAFSYLVRGKMIGGFALVAYPAEYRNSGVMTFLVNHDGAVFQKDLGPRTARIASRMSQFNPNSTWQKVDLKKVVTEKAK